MSGGENNPDLQSTVPISKGRRCPHSVYNPGEIGEPNQACSICRSRPTPKKVLTKDELRSLKRQNKLF